MGRSQMRAMTSLDHLRLRASGLIKPIVVEPQQQLVQVVGARSVLRGSLELSREHPKRLLIALFQFEEDARVRLKSPIPVQPTQPFLYLLHRMTKSLQYLTTPNTLFRMRGVLRKHMLETDLMYRSRYMRSSALSSFVLSKSSVLEMFSVRRHHCVSTTSDCRKDQRLLMVIDSQFRNMLTLLTISLSSFREQLFSIRWRRSHILSKSICACLTGNSSLKICLYFSSSWLLSISFSGSLISQFMVRSLQQSELRLQELLAAISQLIRSTAWLLFWECCRKPMKARPISKFSSLPSPRGRVRLLSAPQKSSTTTLSCSPFTYDILSWWKSSSAKFCLRSDSMSWPRHSSSGILGFRQCTDSLERLSARLVPSMTVTLTHRYYLRSLRLMGASFLQLEISLQFWNTQQMLVEDDSP